MGVYIKGMEMPKDGAFVEVLIWSDGHVTQTGNSYFAEDGRAYYQPCDWKYFSAVPVPPHGRLIDADALVADLKGQVERLFNLDAVSESDFFIERNEKFRQAMWKNWCESFYEYLSARPTVIEAEEVSE